jgi:hypothetical protein
MTVPVPAVVEHECMPMDNPRHRDTCRKCGKPIRSYPELRRNRDFERDVIKDAAGGLMVDPEPLIVFAQRRADQFEREYGHDFPSLERDMAQETLDELGDAANYIAWYLDAIHRGLLEGGDRVTHLQRALRHVVLAFEEIRSTR